jgi:hypothetical protein
MPYAQVRGVDLYYEVARATTLVNSWSTRNRAVGFCSAARSITKTKVCVLSHQTHARWKSRPPARTFPLDFYEQDALDCAALMDAIGCDSTWEGGATAIIGLLRTLNRPHCFELVTSGAAMLI